ETTLRRTHVVLPQVRNCLDQWGIEPKMAACHELQDLGCREQYFGERGQIEPDAALHRRWSRFDLRKPKDGDTAIAGRGHHAKYCAGDGGGHHSRDRICGCCE